MDKEQILFTTLSSSELSILMEKPVRKALGTDHSGMPDGDALLNIKQAALLICYKESTLYALARQNKMPHSKTKGKVLFSRNQLLQWIREAGCRN